MRLNKQQRMRLESRITDVLMLGAVLSFSMINPYLAGALCLGAFALYVLIENIERRVMKD